VRLTCAFAVGISVSSTAGAAVADFPPDSYRTLTTSSFIITGKSRPRRWSCSSLQPWLLFGNDCYKPPADSSHIYHLVKEKREAVIHRHFRQPPGYDGQMSRAEIIVIPYGFQRRKRLCSQHGTDQRRLEEVWPKNYHAGNRIVIRAHSAAPKPCGPGQLSIISIFLAERISGSQALSSPLFSL